jgi:hypothetical protein
MNKPLVQIDESGLTREMTDEEYQEHLEFIANAKPSFVYPSPEADDETPSTD